jgi:hypothetical protein
MKMLTLIRSGAGGDAHATIGLHPNEYKSFVGDPDLHPNKYKSFVGDPDLHPNKYKSFVGDLGLEPGATGFRALSELMYPGRG